MKRNQFIKLGGGLCILGLATVHASSFFTGYSWNVGNGVWSVAANWTPAGGPPDGAGNSATLGGAAAYTVTLDSNRSLDAVTISNANAILNIGSSTLTAAVTNSGTIVSSSGTINGNLTNNASSSVLMPAGSTLNLSSASVTNNGTININSNAGGATTVLHLLSSTSLTGNGVIQMSQQGTWAQLTSAGGATLTNGASHSIQGRGIISASLTNNGTVNANWGGQVLTLNGSAKTNLGTMKSSVGGSALVIDGIAINQLGAGTMISDGDTNNVYLRNGGSISGGSFVSNGASAFIMDSGSFTLNNIFSTANINVNAGQTLGVGSGGIVNNGVLSVNANSGGATTILDFPNSAVIAGTGTLAMKQNGTWAQITSGAGAVVTNASTHTIRGRGQISAGLTNNGQIIADWPTETLRLFGAPKVNNGTMKTNNGGSILAIDGCAVTQSALAQIITDGANNNIGLRSGGSITGGTLTSIGASGFYVDTGAFTLNNIVSAANINIAPGQLLNIGSAGIINNGLIQINYNSGGATTILDFPSSATISGTGTLQMSQQTTWAQLTSSGGGTITNAASHTIKGRGRISAALVNNGMVNADWGTQTLELTGGAKTNNAVMKSSAGGSVLSIDGCAVTQSPAGLIKSEGDNNNVGLRSSGSITGGTLSSTGASGFYVDTGQFTLDNVTNAGKVNIAAGHTLNIGSGGIVNNDSINLNYNVGGAITKLHFPSSATISGTGTLQMSQQGTWAELSANAGATVTNAATHTIKGRGMISAALINNGMVNADWGGQSLILNGATKTNNGTMKSSAGLSVLSIEGCTINQSPSAMIISDGTNNNVGLRSGGTVNGGVFNSVGTSGFYVDTGLFTVNGVTNNGSLNIAAGQELQIGSNGLVNNSSLNINYNVGGATTVLRVPADATISGTGTIQMSQQGTWAQIVADPGATLTHGASSTIQGRGRITGKVTNLGKIWANWGSQTLEVVPSAGFVNQGSMGVNLATCTMSLSSASNFSNAGDFSVITGGAATVAGGNFLQTAGTTTVDGSMALGANKIELDGGVLKGSGTITGGVQNDDGDVQPGNSPGRLTVNGTYSQANIADMTMELGGTTQVTQYDHLQISGAATLNGTLRLKMINGFVPDSSMTFTILNAASVTGQFSNVVIDGPVDLEASVIYSANSVTVTFLTEVDPTAYTITSGQYFGGVLSSLTNSDDDYLYVLCDEAQPVGQVEFTTTSPFASLTHLRFAFETSATRADLFERVQFFNYTTNAWVDMPPIILTTTNDRRRVAVQTTNISQFMNGSRQIKARITFNPAEDLISEDGWSMRIDQASWFLGGI